MIHVDRGADIGNESAVREVTQTAKASAWSLLALILLVEGLYAAYLCSTLQPFPLEQSYLDMASRSATDIVSPFATVLATVQALAGHDLVAARALSITLGLIAVVLAYVIGRNVAQDPVCGAGIALLFILFPPLTATYSLATPHSLLATMILAIIAIGMSARTVEPAMGLRRITLVLMMALLSLMAAAVHPVGAVMAMGGLLISGFFAAWSRQWFAPAIASALAAIGGAYLGLAGDAPFEPDVTTWGHDSILTAAIMPYAMLWLGAAFGGLALFSPSVRARLGRHTAIGCMLGVSIAIGAVAMALIAGLWLPGQAVTGIGYVFPLAALAMTPAVVWVRWVMPAIRSFWAWVLLPVVMYSCFWVVLGPIAPDRFPYGARLESADRP